MHHNSQIIWKTKTHEYKAVKKLLFCDQTNKRDYLCHYRNLKFYINYGMEVTKLKRVIRFKQKPWMKNYIYKKN